MFFLWLFYLIGCVVLAVTAFAAALFVAGVAVAAYAAWLVLQAIVWIAREVRDEWRRARARRSGGYVT